VPKLDRVPFLFLLLEAAERFELLAESSRTPLRAARIACDTGLAPKSGIGIGDDLVGAIVFYGNAKKYKDISRNVISLMARIHEERAWVSYEKHHALMAA